MSQTRKQLFLSAQQLSMLTGIEDPDERRFFIFGDQTKPPTSAHKWSEGENQPWQPIASRDQVCAKAAERKPPMHRVGLVCDADLGKTTNMQWLQYRIAKQSGGRQLPFLLHLDKELDQNAILKENSTGNGLVEELAGRIMAAAGGERPRHLQAIKRYRESGRITLLIDELDHVLDKPEIPELLQRILGSAAWKKCPVWISGQPETFGKCWRSLFNSSDWQFLRIEPLTEVQLSTLIRQSDDPKLVQQYMDERTYFRYRSLPVEGMESAELIGHLETRYCKPTFGHLETRYCKPTFRLAGRSFPVAILWRNDAHLIHPDSILGSFDAAVPEPMEQSFTLDATEYCKGRSFIKRIFETPPSQIKAEGLNYRMTRIDLSGPIPQLHGAFGWYYDNILTQYAMEWELKKALLKGEGCMEKLSSRGTLPLREAVEASSGNPLLSGNGRCAAITVSTLLIFQRPCYGLYCFVRRRSRHVGVSPGMLHVVPAGMFEAKNSHDPWLISLNVWRELLEEVYGEEEQQRTGTAEFPDYMMQKPTIQLLKSMQYDGRMEFSVTGLCCDLLNLRPEICTVIFVKDPAFIQHRLIAEFNWEYEAVGPAETFAYPWKDIDQLLARVAKNGGMVASGAACLGLGREWMRTRFNL